MTELPPNVNDYPKQQFESRDRTLPLLNQPPFYQAEMIRVVRDTEPDNDGIPNQSIEIEGKTMTVHQVTGIRFGWYIR